MKTFFALVGVSGLILLGGCVSTAKKPATVEELFKRADASGDGRVSRVEFEDFMIDDMFAQFDRNGDGFVTEAEFVADGGTVKTFRIINRSGTGKITLAEAKASPLVRSRLAAPFREADANGSGAVTWDEFQAARNRARAYVR